MRIRLRRIKKASDQTAALPAKRLNPLLIFVGAFVIYNLLGLINFPWNISNYYDKSNPWAMFSTALSALFLSYIIFSFKRKQRLPENTVQGSPELLGRILFLVFFGCLALSILSNNGIPLFLGEARFSNSAIIFNLAQMYGLWVLLNTINQIENGVSVKKLPIAIYIIGVTAFGYRTPALVFGLVISTYVLLYRTQATRAIKVGIICGALFITVSALFSGYRVSQDYDVQTFFKNIDFQYISEHPYVAPLAPALAMFDYTQSTVSNIASNLKSHKMGGLFLSNYETFLPGQHWGARNIVGDIVGARWVSGRPMSITPTLQGALYIDFGYFGIFLGALFTGSMIAILHRISLTGTSRMRFIFSYIFSICIISIHNGYWDAAFVFFLAFLLLIKVFDTLKLTFPRTTITRLG